ncbi:hypothetical protein RN001_009366 [Aquatica leii]|uniref:APCDD1 domain-containing protein n=1 Tax=Aquatica leii TaxID=1421715 RepID=A0AAN7Q2F2_9COLE|nr:hypothetical protein RN001_009366 [Aquatica leii]
MNFLVIVLFWTYVNGISRQCAKLSENATYNDRNTVVETSMKTLSGVWLSEGCETRPGSEYVLRHYTFQENGDYKLVQHHYWDDSCSSPKLTIIAIGMLKTKRDSILHHDALSGYNKPSNITIIPQDFIAAKELDDVVATNCPGQYWKSWRKYEEHVVFASPNSRHYKSHEYDFDRIQETIPNTKHYLQNSSGALSCLGKLRWTFNELKLIKIQLRPNLYLPQKTSNEMHWELLVGDIPSREELKENYTPTAFQTPLIKTSKGEKEYVKGRKYLVHYTCNICSNLGTSDRVPPHLIEKARLPPYIWGEWVSQRCEVRPMGLYLTRQFSFYGDDNVWVGEHRFYVDPFCTLLKFVVTASGTFQLDNKIHILKEASNIDFRIEKATLTIYDQHMIYYMPWSNCGKQMWKVGVSQELADTNGCQQLGIIIPSVQYDVVKVEMSYQGYWLLFLGQADTENMPVDSPSERPTAFQVPLVRCGDGNAASFLGTDYEDSGQDRLNLNFIFVVAFLTVHVYS